MFIGWGGMSTLATGLFQVGFMTQLILAHLPFTCLGCPRASGAPLVGAATWLGEAKVP